MEFKTKLSIRFDTKGTVINNLRSIYPVLIIFKENTNKIKRVFKLKLLRFKKVVQYIIDVGYIKADNSNGIFISISKNNNTDIDGYIKLFGVSVDNNIKNIWIKPKMNKSHNGFIIGWLIFTVCIKKEND